MSRREYKERTRVALGRKERKKEAAAVVAGWRFYSRTTRQRNCAYLNFRSRSPHPPPPHAPCCCRSRKKSGIIQFVSAVPHPDIFCASVHKKLPTKPVSSSAIMDQGSAGLRSLTLPPWIMDSEGVLARQMFMQINSPALGPITDLLLFFLFTRHLSSQPCQPGWYAGTHY